MVGANLDKGDGGAAKFCGEYPFTCTPSEEKSFPTSYQSLIFIICFISIVGSVVVDFKSLFNARSQVRCKRIPITFPSSKNLGVNFATKFSFLKYISMFELL